MGIFTRSSARKTVVRRKHAKPPLLPVSAQKFIARRLTDITGTSFVLTSGVLVLSLASYDPRDPSFNAVGSLEGTHNIFGAMGSYTADLLLQTLGVAAWLFPLTGAVWGWRILARKAAGSVKGRGRMLLLSVVLCAVALARLPAPAAWEIGPYMGGSAGGLIFTFISRHLQGWLGSMAFVFLSGTAAGLFCLTYLQTLGLSGGEWVGGMRRTRDVTASTVRTAVRATEALMHWHGKHASSSSMPRPRRARLNEDVAPDAASAVDTEVVEKSAFSLIPRRKPVVAPRLDQQKAAKEDRQKKLNLRTGGDEWNLPSLDLLDALPTTTITRLDESALQKNAAMLHTTLGDFGVQGEILKVSPGPVVALYEMEPAPGTKTSRVVGLADDIARSMSAISARIAAVPGKNAIGIELPNAKRETVYLRELLASRDYDKTQTRLPLVLGKNIAGDPVIADLTRMPHLLVAGTTGSGKSVAVNTMILSLLYRLSPEQCRFIMIDPKMLELSAYDDIPHLLTPVVTEPHKAIIALKWAVREMEDRYRAMSKLGVRNIDGFNERVRAARAKGEALMHRVQTGFDADSGKPVFEEQPISLIDLPYIVVIVDEFADLMLVAGKEVENAIQRLAQMARAAGIHLIMATQRPSVDVITGVIKANFPTRISFQVTSKIDSRTILGEGGAEQLLGQGDMLYMASGGRITRVHGPFVSDGEVEKVASYLKTLGAPDYIDGVTEDDEQGAFGSGDAGAGGGEADALYDQAVALVLRERKASTSFVQRYLQIGYNRAARIIERMEKEGVISTANHAGKREVLPGEYGT